MSKTKEETLWSFPQGESEPYGKVPTNRIYEAMDSWAEQQSIEFLLYVIGKMELPKGLREFNDNDTVSQLLALPKTAKKRYQLFLNDQNKASEIKKRSDNPILD
jgi:transcriptional regulator of heat shock response